jgi:hypothetical protein
VQVQTGRILKQTSVQDICFAGEIFEPLDDRYKCNSATLYNRLSSRSAAKDVEMAA